MNKKRIIKSFNRLVKVIGLLAAIVSIIAYVDNQKIIMNITLILASSIVLTYMVWIIIAKIQNKSSIIIGTTQNVEYVHRYKPLQRLFAFIFLLLLLGVIIISSIRTFKEVPLFERIPQARLGESVILVFNIQGSDLYKDITNSITNDLKEKLEPGLLADPLSIISEWRIIKSKKTLPISQAEMYGYEIGAMFVIAGNLDGQICNLQLALTDSSFVINNEFLNIIGLLDDFNPISISFPVDQISNQLLPISFFIKGIQLFITGQFVKASNHFSRVIDISSEKMLISRAFYLRGMCQVELYEVDSAKDDYKRALKFGLNIAPVHWSLAELYSYTSSGIDSIEMEIEKSFKLSGHSAQSYFVAGKIIFQSMLQIPYIFADMDEYFDKADDYLRVSIEKDPTKLEPIYQRISLHLRYGEILERNTLNEVTSFLFYAIENGGDRMEIRLSLAEIYLYYQETNEAILNLEQAYKLDKSNSLVRLYFASAYDQIGDIPKAINSLKLFLSNKTNAPLEWWNRANAKLRIAILEGDSLAKLFTEVKDSIAETRRKKFNDIVLSSIGKIWNENLYGERSTENLLIYFLIEADIIPNISEKESALLVLKSLIPNERVQINKNNTPLWCTTGIWSGEFIVITSEYGDSLVGVYLDPRPDGKILRMDQSIEGLDFFYETKQICMNLSMVFNGE